MFPRFRVLKKNRPSLISLPSFFFSIYRDAPCPLSSGPLSLSLYLSKCMPLYLSLSARSRSRVSVRGSRFFSL